MSLHTRYRPCEFQAGPSDHNAPVHRRWIETLGWRKPSKAGSTVSTSGSVKEVVGAAAGLQSHGGWVIVLCGPTGLGAVCARTNCGASTAAPIATPTLRSILRRDTKTFASELRISFVMVHLPHTHSPACILLARAGRVNIHQRSSARSRIEPKEGQVSSYGSARSQPSLDHLVRAQQQRLRNGESERLCGFQVDCQVESSRLLHRQLPWIGPLENLVDKYGGTGGEVRDGGTVRKEPSGNNEVPVLPQRRKPVHRCQLGESP